MYMANMDKQQLRTSLYTFKKIAYGVKCVPGSMGGEYS